MVPTVEDLRELGVVELIRLNQLINQVITEKEQDQKRKIQNIKKSIGKREEKKDMALDNWLKTIEMIKKL